MRRGQIIRNARDVEAGAEAPISLPPEGGTPAAGTSASVYILSPDTKVGVPASARYGLQAGVGPRNGCPCALASSPHLPFARTSMHFLRTPVAVLSRLPPVVHLSLPLLFLDASGADTTPEGGLPQCKPVQLSVKYPSFRTSVAEPLGSPIAEPHDKVRVSPCRPSIITTKNAIADDLSGFA